jgi:hypothetical protein
MCVYSVLVHMVLLPYVCVFCVSSLLSVLLCKVQNKTILNHHGCFRLLDDAHIRPASGADYDYHQVDRVM